MNETSEKISNIKQRKIGVIVFGVLLLLTFIISPLYYSGIDNYIISNVLNQVYGSSNHCIFLHYFISVLVKGLRVIFPTVDCYLLIQDIMIFITYILIINAFFSEEGEVGAKALKSALFFFLIAVFLITCANFTLVAAYYCLSGYLLIYYFKYNKKLAYFIIGCTSLILGFMWRTEVFYLSLPFGISMYLWSLIKKTNLSLKYVLCLLVAALITIGSSSYINKKYYSEGIEYNSYRSSIVDYKISDVETIATELEKKGYSVNDYLMIENLMLFDNNIINTEFLKGLDEVKRNATKIDVLGAIQNILKYVVNNKPRVLFIFILFVLCIVKKDKYSTLFILTECLGAVAIVVYFAIVGRLPSRVVDSILILLSFPFFANTTLDWIKNKHLFRGLTIAVFVLCSIKLAALVFGSDYKVHSIFNVYTEQITNYEDGYYIWEVCRMDEFIEDEFSGKDKLLNNEFLNNNFPDGEWTYGQDYFNEYLDELNMGNMMFSLIYNDNWYYVGREERVEIIKTWCLEHYDLKLQAEMKTYNDYYRVGIWDFTIIVD